MIYSVIQNKKTKILLQIKNIKQIIIFIHFKVPLYFT